MSPESLDDEDIAALEEQRDFLLDSIADLDREHDAGDLDDGDYEALRDDYTARAAVVLSELKTREPLPAAPTRKRRVWRAALAACAVVSFAVIAGVLVALTSGQRKPGESLSGAGAIRQSAATEAQACTKLTQEAIGLDTGEMASKGVEALKCYDAVLKNAPDNPVAHAYRGWTAALMARRLDGSIPQATMESLVTQATRDLAAARKADATYPDAIVFSAILKLWQGDVEGSRADLAAFDKLGLPSDNQMSLLVANMLRPQLVDADSSQPSPASSTVAPTTTQPG